MPKKLKCWRKFKDRKDVISYQNIKNPNLFVGVQRGFINIGKEVWTPQVFEENKGITILKKTRGVTFYKSKNIALRRAESYMRKHDKC